MSGGSRYGGCSRKPELTEVSLIVEDCLVWVFCERGARVGWVCCRAAVGLGMAKLWVRLGGCELDGELCHHAPEPSSHVIWVAVHRDCLLS